MMPMFLDLRTLITAWLFADVKELIESQPRLSPTVLEQEVPINSRN